MCTDKGFYKFEASKDAVVDYPALVNSLNNYLWAETDGAWILNGNQVSWSEDPWLYEPEGYPSKIVDSFLYLDDPDGNLVLVEHQRNKRCEGLMMKKNEIYFDLEECIALSEEELIEEVSIHITSGCIEIGSCKKIGANSSQFYKLRIHADRQVEKFISEGGFKDGDAQFYCLHQPKRSNLVEVTE